MGVVPKAKAGVGSAVNDATRLLGGTLGVAVIGSVYASLYASRLTSDLPRGCRPPSPRRARSVGAALTVAGKLGHSGHPALAAAVHTAASSAFFTASAPPLRRRRRRRRRRLMALALLPAQPTASTEHTPKAQAPSRPHRQSPRPT